MKKLFKKEEIVVECLMKNIFTFTQSMFISSNLFLFLVFIVFILIVAYQVDIKSFQILPIGANRVQDF